MNANDNDKAPNNNEAMNTSVSVLPDIQDFDLSPEEFDAIFEGFDLPNVELTSHKPCLNFTQINIIT